MRSPAAHTVPDPSSPPLDPDRAPPRPFDPAPPAGRPDPDLPGLVPDPELPAPPSDPLPALDITQDAAGHRLGA
jgi:hypothetical protein